jgi:hypothetical protein
MSAPRILPWQPRGSSSLPEVADFGLCYFEGMGDQATFLSIMACRTGDELAALAQGPGSA